MTIFSSVIQQLKELTNLYLIFLVIAIGLFTFFVDRRTLKIKKQKKDTLIATIIALLYIFGGPIVFIVLKMI